MKIKMEIDAARVRAMRSSKKITDGLERFARVMANAGFSCKQYAAALYKASKLSGGK